MIKTIHPFPARMAPELALKSLSKLKPQSVVLDPMAGSGTVIRHAASLGHTSIGFDMDPLAVLMSKVWTTPVEDELVNSVCSWILKEAKSLASQEIYLPWIDEDEETKMFIDYWFGQKQQEDLRKVAFCLHKFSTKRYKREKHAAADVLRIALSRIIVTKEQGASLARDTSHSRPHKVVDSSDYDVLGGLEQSLKQVRTRLKEQQPILGKAVVRLGDARSLRALKKESVDAVITSPPYLNAIDYLRGHRMSLVWLGFGSGRLRSIRSNSIGAERAPDRRIPAKTLTSIKNSMYAPESSTRRYESIIERYAIDLYKMVSELSRVTKIGGTTTFIIGNSCLKGNFVRNSMGIVTAAQSFGLDLIERYERDLPERNRYLPLVSSNSSLEKRMRTETIITFEKVKN